MTPSIPEKARELRGYHVREGVSFDRDEEGNVYLLMPGPNQETMELEIRPTDWASIVANDLDRTSPALPSRSELAGIVALLEKLGETAAVLREMSTKPRTPPKSKGSLSEEGGEVALDALGRLEAYADYSRAEEDADIVRSALGGGSRG